MRAELVERAEGNPLFAEQMLALLRETADGESASRPRSRRCWRRASTGSAAERQASAPPPWSGREFWGDAVAALRRTRRRGHRASCSRHSRARSWWAGESTLESEEGFAFTHALIRDAAYESHDQARPRRTARAPRQLAGASASPSAWSSWRRSSAITSNAPTAIAPSWGRSDARASRLRSAPRDGSASAGGVRPARARTPLQSASWRAPADLLPATARERLELMPLIGESLEGTANHAAREGDLRAGDRGGRRAGETGASRRTRACGGPVCGS